jgi:hypothetical protein
MEILFNINVVIFFIYGISIPVLMILFLVSKYKKHTEKQKRKKIKEGFKLIKNENE